MRVGEKEISEQAEIVRRYADLFSREQLEALREAEDAADGDERELLYRLRKTCEGGLVSAELVEREDELENRLLAERVTFRGEEMPLRNAQAQLAVLPAYATARSSARSRPAASAGVQPGPARADRCRRGALAPNSPGSPTRSSATRRRRGSRCSELSAALQGGERRRRRCVTGRCATAGSSGCSAPERDGGAVELPHGLHAPALAARVDVHEGARDGDLPGRR